MRPTRFSFNGKVWLYPSDAGAWHFVTVPKNTSVDITKRFAKVKRGWGSLPIEAKIGKTIWKTSIFPDSKSGTYILPLKALVRKNEGIFQDDVVSLMLTICP